MQTDDRLHYLDNLRALAMLAGVLFHAALAYSPLVHSLFPTADRQGSAWVDGFAWGLHLFRMPLFFAVAGFFAAMLVARRGLGGLLRNRLMRVALPFVLLWPLLHYLLTAITLHAAQTAVHPGPLLLLIRGFLRGSGLPESLPGTDHLWFLYYLMFFYVLLWPARSFNLGAFAQRLSTLPMLWLLVLGPLAVVPALASVLAPFSAPESFLPQFWALGFFGLFFAFGYRLYQEPQLIERLQPFLPWLLLGSAVLYAIFLKLLEAGAHNDWLMALLEAPISVWMTCACLCLGRRWLNVQHGVLRYFADASYWTYLVHLPILFAIQYWLMDREAPWLLKFAAAVVLTMLVCLLSYQYLVRPTALAKLVGVRPTGTKRRTEGERSATTADPRASVK